MTPVPLIVDFLYPKPAPLVNGKTLSRLCACIIFQSLYNARTFIEGNEKRSFLRFRKYRFRPVFIPTKGTCFLTIEQTKLLHKSFTFGWAFCHARII